MSEIRTRAYVAGKLLEENFPLDDVSDHLERDDTIVWVDLCDPVESDLVGLAEELGLHRLGVEDALEPHQRSKLDQYEGHVFLACHSVRLVDGSLDETEIDAFIGARWLVTVRRSDHFSIDRVIASWDHSPELVGQGVGFLLYGLLDVVIDGYFDVIEAFENFYDDVSDSIFSEHPIGPTDQRNWFEMGRALLRFHRLAIPLREVISGLMRHEQSLVSNETHPYFQDVYDHVLRVEESADSLRDLVSTIVETNLSLRDYRQNQVMKKVTSWAAIIAVPTLITGYYGMNVPYPGFGQRSGVFLSSGLIIVLSTALYVTFKRKDWL